jgi:hypothetical protein
MKEQWREAEKEMEERLKEKNNTKKVFHHPDTIQKENEGEVSGKAASRLK